MSHCELLSGYLEVKISSRSRRGFTPWKAWQKQWCEIRKLDSIENGVELKLKSCEEGNVLTCLILPRSSTICRTDSRTKQYAFGVFNLNRAKKPILFLSGSSESDSQAWMSALRKMLCVASYIPVGERNFRVSVVDNNHSRAAGLIGLHGVLTLNKQELVISDPCTGIPKILWKWIQFHQFHLQATSHSVDDKKIIVMHTSGEFSVGAGQLYLYCDHSPKLLQHLVARGQLSKNTNINLTTCKRLSRSEGDLCCALNSIHTCTPDSPLCFRSQTGSEDSGVRVSIASDESDFGLRSKNVSSTMSLGMSVVNKTPGGSETEGSSQDLSSAECSRKNSIPRNESGVSLASGIYEEIPEEIDNKPKQSNKHVSHVYENPLELTWDCSRKLNTPPPLPPRQLDFLIDSQSSSSPKAVFTHLMKPRSNTMPAKDLSKISNIFTESEYVIMSPSKTLDRSTIQTTDSESYYMPMSPIINLASNIECCYMAMGARRS